jgi:glycerate kinase
LEPGFDLFAEHAGLERLIHASDLVITGEGSVDKSTLMGKGVGQLAAACLKYKVPCIAMAGILRDRAQMLRRFVQAHALTDLAGVKAAKSRAGELLSKLATEVSRKW